MFLCVFLCLFFFCYVVVGQQETSNNNFNLKMEIFSLYTARVPAFKPFITFVKSFLLDLTGFRALVSVVSASSYEI